MRVAVLSGGVGGARLARGFELLGETETTVVVNVGDDTLTHGLPVSPDIDTVLYTLAGVEGPEGWGRADDTFIANSELASYGLQNRFKLGDRDLALKIARAAAFAEGETLSSFTERMRSLLQVRSVVLPATDQPVRTEIRVDEGWISFQEYFVNRSHAPSVLGIRFPGADSASPGPGVIEAMAQSDVLVIAPSNPPLSIWPILDVPGIRDAVAAHPNTVAVSPLVGGAAVKGPVVQVMASLGFPPGNLGVLSAYDGLLEKLVVHVGDAGSEDVLGVDVVEAPTLIKEPAAALRLARVIIEL